MRRWLLVLALSTASVSALAANPPSRRLGEFKEPEEGGDKGPKKSRMRAFQEDAGAAIAPEEPFPWRGLALAFVLLSVGGIVGWSFYKETVEELPNDPSREGKKSKKRSKPEQAAD